MHASITTKSTSLHNMSCFVDVVELDVVGFGNGEEECHQVLLQITAGDWLTATIALGLRLEVAIRCEYDNTRNKFKDAMVTGHEKKKDPNGRLSVMSGPVSPEQKDLLTS